MTTAKDLLEQIRQMPVEQDELDQGIHGIAMLCAMHRIAGGAEPIEAAGEPWYEAMERRTEALGGW